jgi:hypothetical protein
MKRRHVLICFILAQVARQQSPTCSASSRTRWFFCPYARLPPSAASRRAAMAQRKDRMRTIGHPVAGSGWPCPPHGYLRADI